MSELEKLFLTAAKAGITKRQIGLVLYGKNWRNIYRAKAQNELNYAIGVLDNLTEIGGVDMEIIKIKKMAGITKREK